MKDLSLIAFDFERRVGPKFSGVAFTPEYVNRLVFDICDFFKTIPENLMPDLKVQIRRKKDEQTGAWVDETACILLETTKPGTYAAVIAAQKRF